MSNRKRFFLLFGSFLLTTAFVFTFTFAHTPTASAAYSEPCPPTQNTGSNDTWVQVIQFNLNADHYFGIVSFPNYPLATDGDFGTSTTTAVHNYQTQVMKIGTGEVGAKTWASLGYCTSTIFIPGYSHTGAGGGSHCPGSLSNGNSGTWVQALQQALNRDANDNYISKGSWFPLALDGSFGTNTENAVKSFQSSNHLTQDGTVGNGTWAAMGMCYS